MSILNNLAVGAIKPASTVLAATGYACRRARETGSALAAGTLIAAGVLAGCASPATGPSSAAPTRPALPGAAAAVARVFNSPHNGFTVKLPVGWSAQGAQPWDGPGSRGLGNDGVDIFRGPPYVTAWAFAAAMPSSLTGYATATARAAAQLPCPAAPQIDQQVTIGGAAASLIGMTCPSQGGVYMLTAATTHKQTALVFVFEDSSGVRGAQQADRAAFRELLTSVRFR